MLRGHHHGPHDLLVHRFQLSPQPPSRLHLATMPVLLVVRLLVQVQVQEV